MIEEKRFETKPVQHIRKLPGSLTRPGRFDHILKLESPEGNGFGQFVFDQCPSNGVLDRRDTRVAAEMEHYYAQTKQLIVENRDKLDKLITRLVEEKTLLGDQVQAIIRCA